MADTCAKPPGGVPGWKPSSKRETSSEESGTFSYNPEMAVEILSSAIAVELFSVAGASQSELKPELWRLADSLLEQLIVVL